MYVKTRITHVFCGSVVCCKNTKYRMRNDLSISITEPNLSDPDVREFSYRGVGIHLFKLKFNLICLI